MRAIDADVMARYLTGDDPDPSAGARAAVDSGAVFASTTVLPEREWFLCSVCGLAPDEVAAALRAFAGPPGVAVEHPALFAEARDRAEAGMDFADALHLGPATRCNAMPTFDRRFIEQARGSTIPIIEP